jgi:hypothetical protein
MLIMEELCAEYGHPIAVFTLSLIGGTIFVIRRKGFNPKPFWSDRPYRERKGSGNVQAQRMGEVDR